MPGRPPDNDKTRLRLWLRLLKATRHVEAQIRERLRTDFNTTLPRFDVMAALEKNRAGLKMSDLSRQLMVSNGNVTGIVDRLVEDGLVARLPISGDRRATLVHLTPTGLDTFAKMARAHEKWVGAMLETLEPSDIQRATALLLKIRKVPA